MRRRALDNLSNVVISGIDQSTGRIVSLPLNETIRSSVIRVIEEIEDAEVPVPPIPPAPTPIVTDTEVSGISPTQHNEEINNSTPIASLDTNNTGSVVLINNGPPGSEPNIVVDFNPSATANFWEIAVATPVAFSEIPVPLCTVTLVNRTGFPVQLNVQQEEGSSGDYIPPQFVSYSAVDGEVLTTLGSAEVTSRGNLTSSFIRLIRIGANDIQAVYIGTITNTYRPIFL